MTEILNIDHEGGNLSEYDSTVTDGGDLSVTAAAALASTDYGLQCVVDDTTAIYGQANISPSGDYLRYRFYLDPNSLSMGNWTDHPVLLIQTNESPWNISYVSLTYEEGHYSIFVRCYEDDGSQSYSGYIEISDAPHYIEVCIYKASNSTASDGYFTVWIDGTQEYTSPSQNLDYYDIFDAVSHVRWGAPSGVDFGASGTFYLDQLVINDDGSEIGEHATVYTEDVSQTITIVASRSDVQDYQDDVSATLTIAASREDVQAYLDDVSQTILAATSRSDVQTYLDDVTSPLLITASKSDLQAYVDDASQTVLIVASRYDGRIFTETGLTQTVAVSLTRSDLQDYLDDVTSTVSIAASKSDGQTYLTEERAQTVTIVGTTSDLQAYTDGVTATLVIVLSGDDRHIVGLEAVTQTVKVQTSYGPISTGTKILIYDSNDHLVAHLRRWLSLSYILRVNEPDEIEITLHRSQPAATHLIKGNKIEVIRDGVTVFAGKFDWVSPQYDEQGAGSELVTVRGPSFARLPKRQILRPSGEDARTRTDTVDDAIKYFVRHCYESGHADASRVLSGFTVEADDAEHPDSKTLVGGPQDDILSLLKAWGAAYSIDWWVDASIASGSYVFRTRYPQRGSDRTGKVVFSIGRQNVRALRHTEDDVSLANVVYVGGPGEGASQTVNDYYDGAEPTGWDREEAYVPAADAEVTDELAMVGGAYLESFGRSVTSVEFTYRETPACRWLHEFNLGDLVTVYDPVWSKTVNAKIEQVKVAIDERGTETIALVVGKPQQSEWERLQAKIGAYSTFDDDSAPSAPTNPSTSPSVTEDDQGNQSVTLALDWDDNNELDLDGYQVEIRASGDTEWRTQRVTESQAAFDGLDLGGIYYARVAARDRASNISAYTDFNGGSTIALPSDTSAPDDPTGLTAYSRFRAVALEWTNPNQSDLDHIEVWRNSSASWSGATLIGTVGGNTFTDEIGVWDSSFYYAVRAVDRVGNASGGTAWIEGSTDTTPPSAPTSPSSSSGTVIDADGHIIPYLDVSWTDSIDDDAKSHEVEIQYSTDGGSTWWDPVTQTSEVSPLRISPVPGNVSYRARVRAVDDANLRSDWTGYTTGTTATDSTVPTTPTGLAVSAAIKAIRISIDQPSDADWAGAEFHVSTSNGFTPSASTLVHVGRTTSILHKVDSYATRYVRVRVYDSSGNYSSYAAQGSATPDQTQGGGGNGDIDPGSIIPTDVLIDSVSSTYLDDWHWGSGEMDGAYIHSLSASQITTGVLDAARVSIGASSTFSAGYNPSDGRSVIRATSAPSARPSGQALRAGDMWIETDNGNKPYVWNGSAWQDAYISIGLDSSGGEIWINNATFGNSGIQIQYNSGSPRFYVGNGSNEYLQYTSSGLSMSFASGAVTFDSDGIKIAEGVGNMNRLIWKDSNDNDVMWIYGYGSSRLRQMMIGNSTTAIWLSSDSNSALNRYISFQINSASSRLNIYEDKVEAYVDVRINGGLYVGASGVDPDNDTVEIANRSSNPSTPSGGATLFASSGELRGIDSSGNVTVLTPHRFDFIPDGPSEPMAWAHYGERDGWAVNVDMLALAREVERLSNKKLVYIERIREDGDT